MKKMAIIFGCLLLAWFTPATAQPQLQLTVSLPNDPVDYGDPLVIEMLVENVGDEASGNFSIGSSNFHRIYYFGDTQEGCTLFIAPTDLPDPVPSMPPLFGFVWPNDPLQAGESRLCRVTFPMILYPGGEETIDLRYYTGNGSTPAASFTYTLLGEPPEPVAQPVPAIRWPALAFLAFALGIIGAGSVYRSRRTI